MKTIKCTLSTKSLKSAVKELKAYKADVEKKAVVLLDALVAQGVTLAQMNASSMSIYDSGALVNGIVGDINGNVGHVKSTAPHSIFCEFGTGVKGKNSPHPDIAILGWTYDTNSHGELGWWYFDEKQQRFRWTKGMPSRPFMYETAELLKSQVEPIARSVFND
ncbi:MAG: hypothetical protein RR902_00540 [Oscillospiraceae bacterium]